MKKLTILTIAMVFFSLLSHAQFIEKGKRILGGSINMGFNASNDSTHAGGSKVKTRNISVNLSPSYGKAIKADLVFGYYAGIGFSSYRLEQSQLISRTNGSQFGGGLFMEKFFSLSNRLAVSGHLSGGVNYSTYTSKFYEQNTWRQTNETRNIGAGISLAPLLNYKLTHKMLIGLSANDLISINYVKGTVEASAPNTSPKKTEHNSFFAGTMFNNGKLLRDIIFSFRFLL